MNIGTVSRVALRAVQNESIENKILVSKKIIRDLEDHPNEASFRLCRDLRAVLKAAAKDPLALAEQISDAGSLLSRVQKLDPRNQKTELAHRSRGYDDEAHQEPIKPKAPVPDGFEPGFLDIGSAIDRVTTKYDVRPPYTDVENDRLLQTFLGDDVSLDSHSANQIWQALAREYKSRAGGLAKPFTSLFPPQVEWVQTSLCFYVNRNQVSVLVPNCLSISEDIGFRS